uniref:Apolipoprotein Bb, tandem duplicate 1 n=1 Tax=Mastacembelus armatus TaxID=205130 RepID=A0A7N8Y5J6_9TELE
MGDSKLCLLLLLSTSALALAKRYKTLHKYEYRYEAESLNAINGASLVKNGPKASCTVEIEVPQTCSFIVRTTGCSLSEVVDTDAEGNPVFGPAPTSDAFAAEMEKYPLKVVVEDVYNVQLYPEEGETTTILNIKRGIISALAVPLLEEDKNKNMPTVHGKCRTYYKVNAREDIVTDISLNRDLSRCDNFVPMRDYSSPLALISGMHYPLAQLVRSSQTCNYKFDNEKKHMTSGSCTENHLLIPFSHKGEYGVTNVGKQEITLVQVSPHNDRVFDPGKPFAEFTVEDKSAVQDKDAAVNLLRELATLPETEGERRAHLFHKLVTMVRGMKTETLTHAIPEALAVSPVLTYQVLAQCGTPECSSSIMQILRTFDSSSFKVDATVFAMGLVSNPSALLINDMLEMAKYKPSKPIMYALSNVVKRFYKAEEKLIPEIDSVAEFMAAHLGDCSNDKATFMTLRVIGNMAPAVIPASPALRAAVIQCVNQPAASAAVQQAAIQVYRLTPVPEENRKVLMQVFLDSASPMQKRIAAYLVLIKDPRPNELVQLADVLTSEQNIQVKSFVMSHIVNILSSTDPETKELRQRIRNAMQDNSIESIMDPTKLSRNYKIGSVEGNMIFEGTSYLPREVMLDMTLKAFGFEFDMMEVGMEGKGFEPTVDALFGENGFFPDTALKAMYFVSDNVPQHIVDIYVLASQNLMSEIGQNLDKLLKELKAAQSPEAMVYLRLLGNELGYLNTNEIEEMLIKAMMTRTDNTFFAHYIFMDNEFFLPTVTGFPLRIGLSGTFTPGVKGGLKIAHDMSEITFMPSVGIEFVTQVGCHIPEYVNSGLEMHTSIFHERGLNVQISMGHDQIKLTIPAPMSPTKLIKITNSLVAVTGSEMRTIPSVVTDKVDVNECNPVFAGMKYCTALQYTDAFSHETAPYFPFTGDSKFAVELHPTGEVTEYTATVAYELLKVGEEGRQKVDTLKVILRAEGNGQTPTEARAIMKYNRKKNVVTADIEIPDYDVEAGVRLGVVDGKTKGKGTHSISLDFINKNIPQLSLVGRSAMVAITDSIRTHLKSSFAHELLEASISIHEDISATDKLNLKSSSKIEAKSPLGLSFALDYTSMTGINKEEISADNNFVGMFNAGPMYGKTTLTQSFTIFPFRPEAKIDSTFQCDSTIVKAQNTIAATLANGELSVVSNTHAFEDILTHVFELTFKDNKLSLKCDANALGVKTHHLAEASTGPDEFVMRLETNADLSENRVYTLLQASVSVNAVGVSSDATVKLFENEAVHKATLKINKDGLTTSGTTTLNSPLSLENTFNAGLDSSSATLAITNKAAVFNTKINNANTLSVTLSSLDFNSRAEIAASEDASYTHAINVDLKPYSASAIVNNNVKLLAAIIANEAQLKAEPYKMDLTGILKANYGQEEIKHTYQVNYADMTANAKCSTTGKLFGTHMNHNTELEIVGLAARLTNSAIFNSQLMRFDHSMHSSLIPFDFNVDAIFNVDGDITMHGKHSAQLYGKYILKAQPLAFASSLDSRSSVTQKLDNGFSLETTFDNKIETVLSIQEQKTNFRIRSKMNEHAFNQEMSVYNTPDRAGIEVSGTILTDILNTESTENQEFTISGFLKYDKNTDCHIILFPLSEHLPAFLEHIKHCVVIIAEALRDYINNEEVRAKLEAFPQHVINFVSKLNVESKIIRLKKYFDDITQRNVIYFEDFHMFLSNLMFTLKNILTDLTVYIEHFAGMIKQIIQSCNLHQHLIEKIHQELIALDEKYDIKNVVVYVIGTLREILQEMDLEELKGSSIEFLRDIDAKYEIKAKLENIMLIIKEIIERFDMQESAAKLKRKIEELVDQISTDTVRHIIHVTMDMIRDLDIIGMTNTFYNILRELIIKFEAEKKVQAILEKAVELIKQLRTEETVKAIVGIVKGTKIEFMRGFENIIIYLKSTEVKDIIQHLNVYIEETVENLNSLNYKDTVDFVNVIIRLDTAYLNELIRTLEIPQKLEATRDFINVVISSVRGFMEHAREVRIAEFIKAGKAVIVGVPFEILERVFKFADRTFIKLGIKDEILAFQNFVISCMFEVTHTIKNAQTIMYEMIQKVVPEQIIIKTEEIVNSFASETVGRILYYYVFQFNFNTLVDELFGDLKINFLPSMPEITIPEISLTEISFPTIPKIPVEKLVKSLAVPEMKLPTIPNEIMVPCFGKLYGEINFVTPIYTIKTSAEFHNSTENTMTPQFTGFITSQAESTSFEILNYKLDSTARIVMPKRIRVVLSETLKFNHLALGVEHQASLSIYGLSAQAQSKTNVKVTTTPYTANIENLAFIAVEEGMSGSLHTSYSHIVDLPALNVRSETKVDQKSTALQDGLTLLLKFENMGTVKFNGDYGKHISDMQLSLTPNAVKLSFSGNTDSTILKMKQEIAAEFGTLTFFKFNIRNEAESPVVKNSLLVASGHGSLHDMKAELKANHHTELYGGVTGTVTNGLTFVIHPNELVFEFQNKGNAKVNIVKSLIAKLELQNDYSAIFKPDSQQMNTVALVRLNQYKMFYNVTVDSNENEAGIFVAMENGANLDFLTYPISIPELALPFVDFHSPAINDLNLYEHTGLQNILITTEQTVDVDAKIVYQKKQAAPFFHIVDLIPVPRMGNLISELSFKSAIINLNVNTGLYAEDDFVFRLGAYTTSVFEGLKAKLHGTTSLTTQRGIKLANSLSLENRHIEGTQDITISMSTETSETAVSMNTVAKISLPILELEANQNLAVTTMTKTNAVATLMIKADFNIPVIKAVGNAKAGHSLKLDGTSEYISMETATKANMDGSVFEDYQVLGLLDNEVNLYLNHDGLRSTSKITADASLNHGVTKIIGIDVNEGLEVEASLGRVYAVMKYTGNNEANLFNFNTNGKHIAQATINLAPASSLNADVEIDITQPSSLGELTIFEKTVAEVTPEKQKISINAKFVSPLYTTNLASEVEGNDLVFKITLKSSATSPILLLEYDMDGEFMKFSKDINLFSFASIVERKRRADDRYFDRIKFLHVEFQVKIFNLKVLCCFLFEFHFEMFSFSFSMSQHTLKLDITSPIFTDVNFRYDAHTDGVSASVSTPSSGFLGFQLNVQSLMRARVYGRYPSAPEVDIDILIIQLASVDADKTNMQIVYNMEAPKMFISELKMKLPSIISTVTLLADKYQITKPVEELKNFFVNRINEVYDAAVNYDNQMSQLSIFFSNIIVGYQKTVQGFLDAVIKVLRETQFKLPGSHEMTTLPEVLKKVVDSIAVTLDMVMQVIYNNIEVYYDSIRNIEFDTGDGGVITVDQILNGVKMDVQDTFEELIDFVKNMESLDTVLVELGETLEAIVEKSQEFVDSIKSDYLDAVFIDINAYYENLIIDIKNVVDKILNMEQLKNYFEYIMDMLIYVVDQFNNVVYDVLQQSSDKAEAYLKVNNGRLEIELPFPLKQ